PELDDQGSGGTCLRATASGRTGITVMSSSVARPAAHRPGPVDQISRARRRSRTARMTPPRTTRTAPVVISIGTSRLPVVGSVGGAVVLVLGLVVGVGVVHT